eukprot:360144_1
MAGLNIDYNASTISLTQLLNKEIIDNKSYIISDHEFEEAHNILVEKCNNGTLCPLSNCLMRRRNFRDRDRLRSNDRDLNKMYFSPNDMDDVINQQILDTIHCHYFHSFDAGYKLSQQQKIEIEEMTKTDEKRNNMTDDKIAAAIYK